MPGVEKIVFLNWLVSRSVTRARHAAAPTHPAVELFELLAARMKQGYTIEFPDLPSNKIQEDQDEQARISEGAGQTCMRLADISKKEADDHLYFTFLLKYLDSKTKGFSVEDMVSFAGREIAGTDNERGVKAAHLSVRVPRHSSQFDDGRYRCTVDSASPLTRSAIERFLCRQLHRQTAQDEWTFTVSSQKGHGKPVTKIHRYTPRLELHGDVGRMLQTGAHTGQQLSSMIFTKRAERKSVGAGIDVHHTDFVATTEIKIYANQAPENPTERLGWIDTIRAHYSGLGFESKLYYRHANGILFGGDVHQDVDGAADLLMCPKTFLAISGPVNFWSPKVNSQIEDGMRGLLDQDELWEHNKK